MFVLVRGACVFARLDDGWGRVAGGVGWPEGGGLEGGRLDSNFFFLD